MKIASPCLKVPPGYLKQNDIIQHGIDKYEFISYLEENEKTYHAKAVRLSDNVKKRIILHKKTWVSILNDQPAV